MKTKDKTFTILIMIFFLISAVGMILTNEKLFTISDVFIMSAIMFTSIQILLKEY